MEKQTVYRGQTTAQSDYAREHNGALDPREAHTFKGQQLEEFPFGGTRQGRYVQIFKVEGGGYILSEEVWHHLHKDNVVDYQWWEFDSFEEMRNGWPLPDGLRSMIEEAEKYEAGMSVN